MFPIHQGSILPMICHIQMVGFGKGWGLEDIKSDFGEIDNPQTWHLRKNEIPVIWCSPKPLGLFLEATPQQKKIKNWMYIYQ